MRRDTPPDMSGLARLAQSPDADLRPLLLRVQTQAFAASPRREGDVRDYTAIALGLIPLVTDDVLADAAALLRTVEDAPAAVLAALASRLDPGDAVPTPAANTAAGGSVGRAIDPNLDRTEAALGLDAADLALARNTALRIDGHLLDRLVQRARTQGDLAEALLARSEPGILHRAALYRFAEREMRASIRAELALHLARSGPTTPIHDRDAAARVRSLATAQRPETVWLFLAAELGLFRDRALDLETEYGRERLVFALRALDMPADDCIAVLLTLDWAGARSVTIVFELAALARGTGVPVARALVGTAEARFHRASAEGVDTKGGREFDRSRRGPAALHRAEAGAAVSAARPVRPAAPTAPFGRRSTATTGPGRT